MTSIFSLHDNPNRDDVIRHQLLTPALSFEHVGQSFAEPDVHTVVTSILMAMPEAAGLRTTRVMVPYVVSGPEQRTILSLPTTDIPTVSKTSAVIEPLESILESIGKVVDDADAYEDGDNRPSEIALGTARELLQLSGRSSFPAPDIVPFDGRLRLTWDAGARNVRLVCDSIDAAKSYIYREKVRNRKAYAQRLLPATPQNLNLSLEWLRERPRGTWKR